MKLLENLERERQKIVPPPASSIFLLSLQFTRGQNVRTGTLERRLRHFKNRLAIQTEQISKFVIIFTMKKCDLTPHLLNYGEERSGVSMQKNIFSKALIGWERLTPVRNCLFQRSLFRSKFPRDL